MPLLFAWLPSGSVLHLVTTVAARDPRGFMWERALWLAGKHTGFHVSENARVVGTRVSALGLCD